MPGYAGCLPKRKMPEMLDIPSSSGHCEDSKRYLEIGKTFYRKYRSVERFRILLALLCRRTTENDDILMGHLAFLS